MSKVIALVNQKGGVGVRDFYRRIANLLQLDFLCGGCGGGRLRLGKCSARGQAQAQRQRTDSGFHRHVATPMYRLVKEEPLL